MAKETFDPREFRSALGRFATGVTVVTYATEDDSWGFTVNSFTSVSLDPPLVLVSVGNHAQAASRMRERPFAINVLREEQQNLAFHFSGREQENLNVDWIRRPGQAPELAGSLAVFQCQPWKVIEAGDHDLHIGEVTSFSVDTSRVPLVFLDGQFSSLQTQSA